MKSHANAQADAPIPSATRSAPGIQRHNQPNILLLMADQFRMDCAGVYGNHVIRTPHLDRLGQEGIRFQNAYSTTPTCIPARSALLSMIRPLNQVILGMSRMVTNSYRGSSASVMGDGDYYTSSIG